MSNDVMQAIDQLRFAFRRYRRLILLIAAVVVAIGLLESTFFSVKANEQGVLLRFGRQVKLAQPGLHMKLPWPIDQAILVPTEQVKSLDFGYSTLAPGRRTVYGQPSSEQAEVSRMLTGDLNLAHVEWAVQYRIHDAAEFLFGLGAGDSETGINRFNQIAVVEDTIRDVSETVMRRLVGDVSVDEVLTTGRDRIADDGKREIQSYLDRFECGVTVVTVELQTVSPPEQVKDAFDSVNRARQNKERVINEAKGERNRLVPEARGKRDRTIAEAEGYRDRIVKSATGQANAFLSKLAAYKEAPEVTRMRMYLETMESVLDKVADVLIIDESVRGLLPLLDLQKRGEPAAPAEGGGA